MTNKWSLCYLLLPQILALFLFDSALSLFLLGGGGGATVPRLNHDTAVDGYRTEMTDSMARLPV